VRGRRLTVRSIALLGAGAAAIHQLRYAIGYGDAAPRALAAHGHGYLAVALPGVLTAALIALAGMLMRLAGARRGSNGVRGAYRTRVPGRSAGARVGAPLAVIWLAATVALATIYGSQETLEGAGAFAGGGWIGLALAVPAGLLVALALRGARAAEELRTAGAILRAFVIPSSAPVAHVAATPPRLPDLRFGARGPPAASVV
jgi:hypothetical protein